MLLIRESQYGHLSYKILQLTADGRIGVFMGIVWSLVEKVIKQGVERAIHLCQQMEVYLVMGYPQKPQCARETHAQVCYKYIRNSILI